MAGEWQETQKRLLVEESDSWLDRHGMRMQRLRLPLQLPQHCSSWADVAAELERHPIHLKLLNHQRLLGKRLRGNWSYLSKPLLLATITRFKPMLQQQLLMLLLLLLLLLLVVLPLLLLVVLLLVLLLLLVTVSGHPASVCINAGNQTANKNGPSEARNKGLPFRVQSLPRSVAAELQQLGHELLHEEFDGLLLTIQSKEVKPNGLMDSPVQQAVGASKVFAGCVIESLASNERQLRAVWVNRRLSARSTRLLLQVLLPRAVVEAFSLEGFAYSAAAMLQQQQQQQQQQARVQSFKSVFVDRRDLDIWPRQCWMLLPSHKNFGWPLHYDVKGKAAVVHLDAGVSGTQTCSCHLTRSCLPASEQASIERFLMVSEPLLHLLLPPRSERTQLQIEQHPLFSQSGSSAGPSSGAAAAAAAAARRRRSVKSPKLANSRTTARGGRRGWREFIDPNRDEEFAREASPTDT
ncbi:hypothetical protein Efla_004570 [Eimeria flavescens]